MPGRDDPLSWDGDEDPTLDTRVPDRAADPAPAATPASPVSVPVEQPAPEDAEPEPTDAAEPAPMGNVMLVSLGVFGGVYLLLMIGWFIGGARLQVLAQLFLDPVGYLAAWAMAVVAPVVWFGTVLLTTRSSRPWLRIVLLVVGAVALLPWPFLMVGVGL